MRTTSPVSPAMPADLHQVPDDYNSQHWAFRHLGLEVSVLSRENYALRPWRARWEQLWDWLRTFRKLVLRDYPKDSKNIRVSVDIYRIRGRI